MKEDQLQEIMEKAEEAMKNANLKIKILKDSGSYKTRIVYNMSDKDFEKMMNHAEESLMSSIIVGFICGELLKRNKKLKKDFEKTMEYIMSREIEDPETKTPAADDNGSTEMKGGKNGN
jgi:cellobiose-specific phosphotransferase system component IIA